MDTLKERDNSIKSFAVPGAVVVRWRVVAVSLRFVWVASQVSRVVLVGAGFNTPNSNTNRSVIPDSFVDRVDPHRFRSFKQYKALI